MLILFHLQLNWIAVNGLSYHIVNFTGTSFLEEKFLSQQPWECGLGRYKTTAAKIHLHACGDVLVRNGCIVQDSEGLLKNLPGKNASSVNEIDIPSLKSCMSCLSRAMMRKSSTHTAIHNLLGIK